MEGKGIFICLIKENICKYGKREKWNEEKENINNGDNKIEGGNENNKVFNFNDNKNKETDNREED